MGSLRRCADIACSVDDGYSSLLTTHLTSSGCIAVRSSSIFTNGSIFINGSIFTKSSVRLGEEDNSDFIDNSDLTESFEELEESEGVSDGSRVVLEPSAEASLSVAAEETDGEGDTVVLRDTICPRAGLLLLEIDFETAVGIRDKRRVAPTVLEVNSDVADGTGTYLPLRSRKRGFDFSA